VVKCYIELTAKSLQKKGEIPMQAMLILNLIVPFVMVLVGSVLKKHPVSDRSRQSGYNTPISRKSQAHWDYAQGIAPDIYISLGKRLFIVETIGSILCWLLRVPLQTALLLGEGAGFGWLIYSFYYTDRKIQEKFVDK
jgi:hypothetical protein